MIELTLADFRAIKAAYWSACGAYADACHERDQALAERDRARDTAARLEAELARGHRIAAPDVTLTRTSDGAPGTPDEAVPGPSGALGRPGSEIRYADAYPHKNGPESPSATRRP